MGDAGEALIDAEARIQERIEEMALERARTPGRIIRDPEAYRALESLKLARTEVSRQLNATTHPGRRSQLSQALEELDRRIASSTAC